MVATAEKLYTVEEYFALEETAEDRHEFVHGKLIFMPGESKHANLIGLNCAFAFKKELKGKGFFVLAHDVRLIVELNAIFRYPDVMVAPNTDQADTHAITQPVVIVEVFSKNSAPTDRGEKLLEYTQLPSLQHYLLISQTEPLVEMYSRRDNEWVFSFYKNVKDVIELAGLGVSIQVEDLYEEVVFDQGGRKNS
jgi:Uma2 family endonuclease